MHRQVLQTSQYLVAPLAADRRQGQQNFAHCLLSHQLGHLGWPIHRTAIDASSDFVAIVVDETQQDILTRHRQGRRGLHASGTRAIN